MRNQTPPHAADFFVLRAPSLPMQALYQILRTGPEPPHADLEADRVALRKVVGGLVRSDAVREALALASPDLAARIDRWCDGSLPFKERRQVEQGLLKYLGRMSSRSTPFGLFAGFSLAAWGPVSRLDLPVWREGRKAVRLDWGVLEALVDQLEREPEVRAALSYRPNSSLYARGGWFRYLERRPRPDGQGRSYHLEAAEATPHLDFVLEASREGARLEELAAQLASRMGVDLEAARGFLDQLVDAQVLCGDLQPPLTSPDPLGGMLSTLRGCREAADRAAPLAALAAALKGLEDAAPGGHPEGAEALTEILAELGAPTGVRDVLQVALQREAPGLALSPAVRRALEAGVETLHRLTPVAAEGPLDRFRAAFRERYGLRWVPLLEALDEESGLGFDGGVPLDSPLLEGLDLPGPTVPSPRSSRDSFLLKQVPRWQGSRTWELDDSDVEALAHPDPGPFAPAFAALASLEAASPADLDRGAFLFWMEQHSGPTAARWLGRFASGDPRLEGALRRHLALEASRQPEAVFAEVVHVPEGREGNILARPALRDWEIPFLAASGAPEERTLLPSDLQVSVRGDRVILASRRLGREVLPRLSSAHNVARGPAVYRFLAHLQDQGGRPGGWSWGALADLPFLPRVTRGRHVLSKARWRIEAGELQAALGATADGAWGAFQILRKTRDLPRLVVLTDADHCLLVDLDRALWAETLHHLVARRASFLLTECFPDPAQALVTSPEGSYAHELVVAFEAPAPVPAPASPLPVMSELPGPRSFPPGSEWLYLKAYCGPASADRLLVELEPILDRTRAQQLWDRWHFIRYRDPDPHLRLRFHGQPDRLLSELLPQLHAHLEPRLAQGLLWKWQVETFEPEWERYGGPLGFPLAEAWFGEDSGRVLDLLREGLPQEQRWRVGLRNMDGIWADLGLGVGARRALAVSARDAFRKEFADAGEGSVQMGAKFRSLRRELEQGFPSGPERSASRGLDRIRTAAEQGLLREPLASLAGSLTHMHLNRLLRADHRENEWVLMEFLVRLYDSHLARFPET